MARIKTYAQDANINDQDRILGTSFEGVLNNKPIYKTRNYRLTDLAAYFSQNFDFEGLNFNVALLSETITANTAAIASANLSLSVLTNDVLAQATFQVNLAASFGTYDDQGNLLTLAESFANQVLQTTSSARFAEATALTELETTFTSDIADVNASISAEQLARSTADTALASDITELEASVATDVSNLSAAITTEQTARVTQDEALAQDITTLDSTVSNIPLIFKQTLAPPLDSPIGSLWFDTDDGNKRYILVEGTPNAWQELADGEFTTFKATAESELQTLATDISAEASKITNLNSILEILDANGDPIPTNQADYFDEITTYVDANSATASSLSTLTATVGSNTSSITTNQNAIATVDGKLTASYGITVDAGGRVAGLKLLADGSTGSEFIARANTFAVDMPNGTRVMTVNSSGMTINGRGTFTGSLTGASGTFGTVTLNSGGISGVGFTLNGSGLSLSAGSISLGNSVVLNSGGLSGPGFSLNNGGLTATGATISGAITITSGSTLSAIQNAQSTADTAINDASDAASAASNAQSTANAAQNDADAARNVTDDLTSVISLTNTKLYQGPGTWGGSTTGFYLDNNGFFSLKNKLTFNATSNTLTVNGSGVFSGELDAGLVNINNSIITVGYNASTATGKISFLNSLSSEVTRIKSYSFTSPNGGGIDIAATLGTNPGSLRLGCDSSGLGIFDIEANGTRIYTNNFGGNKILQFYSDNSNYRFQGLYFKNVSLGTSLYVNGSGDIGGQTSSLRFKENVVDYERTIDDVKKLRPVRFNYKEYPGIGQVGMIAEELHDAGLTEFVRYDNDDKPFAIAYEYLVTLLTKGIQEQQEQIDALKAEIELLKAQ